MRIKSDPQATYRTPIVNQVQKETCFDVLHVSWPCLRACFRLAITVLEILIYTLTKFK